MPFMRGIRPRPSRVLATGMPRDMSRRLRSVIRWIFDPHLSRSSEFGPVSGPLLPPAGSRNRSGNATSPAPPGAELVEDQAVELGPHPRIGPLGEPAERGHSRGAETGRQLVPGAARSGHEDDRGEHLPIPVPPPATALRALRGWWNHPLEQLPQVIRRHPLNKRGSHRSRLPQDHTKRNGVLTTRACPPAITHQLVKRVSQVRILPGAQRKTWSEALSSYGREGLRSRSRSLRSLERSSSPGR